MSEATNEPLGIEQEWREPVPSGRPSRGQLWLRRSLIAVLCTAAVVTLVIVLVRLFSPPKTHLLVLRSSGLAPLNGPVVPIAGHEVDLLDTLREVTRYRSGESVDRLLDAPDRLHGLSAELKDQAIDTDDTLIVYVAAHGIALDGSPSLVCNNFDPSDPEGGLCALNVVLETVNKSPARTKLVILDAGWMDYDPQLGIVADDFSKLVRQAVRSLKAPTSQTFVFCSHDQLQRSHHSYALGGSVFGVFVAAGLQGAADLDGDNYVSVRELETFVKDGVSNWVSQLTAGESAQTPQLYSYSESQDHSESTLLDIRALPEPRHALDIQSIISSAHGDHRVGDIASSIAGPSRGYLAHLSDEDIESEPPKTTSTPERAEGSDASAVAPDGPAAVDQATEDRDPGQSSRSLQVAKQLARAWRVSEELSAVDASATPVAERPVDSTPHLWRELQEELLAYDEARESTTAVASIPSTKRLASAIANLVPTASDGVAQQEGDTDVSGAKATTEDKRLPVSSANLRSLALARLFATRFHVVDKERIVELQATLDGLIESAPDELADRISRVESTPEMLRYYELRLIHQLGDVARSEPELAQLALQCRRHGEQVAAQHWWCASWLCNSIQSADRRRIAGEQQMLDQIESDWPMRARRDLEAANRLYEMAAQDAIEIGKAKQLRNDITFRARYYLPLLRHNGGSDEEFKSASTAISKMFAELRELAELIDKPDPARIGRVAQLRNSVQATVDGPIADYLGYVYSDGSLVDGGSKRVWRMSRLLDTPLLSGKERSRLTSLVRQLDMELAENFNLSSPLENSGSSTQDRIKIVCQLEVELAQLVRSKEADELRAQTKDLSEPKKFGSELARFYRTLTSSLRLLRNSQEPVEYIEARNREMIARRALQLLDARDAHEFRDLNVDQFSRKPDVYSTLVWQAKRCNLASAGVSPGELAYLDDTAERYREAASGIYELSESGRHRASQLQIAVGEQVDLVIRKEQKLPISLSYDGIEDIDVWLVIEYDRRFLEVVSPDNVYHERHLPDSFPYRPDLEVPALPATWLAVSPGDKPKMELWVRSRAGSNRPAILNLRAIARPVADSSYATQASDATNAGQAKADVQVRYSVEIPVRLIDAVLEGASSTWQQAGDRFVLQTFPNNVTEYRFGVVNSGGDPRDVALRFFMAPRGVRLDALSPTELGQLMGRLSPIDELKLPAPADGKIHFAASALVEPVAQVDSEASQPGSESGKEADSAEALSTKLPISGGLILEVSDPKDPTQTSYKQLEIVSQRPRRFIRPTVSYNSRLERIEVTARPRTRALLPDRPVRVAIDIADDVDATAKGKLQDLITAPAYEAKMFVNIPANPPRDITLNISVDEYPRAFVYRVPCGSGAADLPEETNLSELRLLSADGSIFQSPAATTEIVAQIDSPVGEFDSGGDYLQMALDDNLDKQLGPEVGIRFDSDRQANAFLGQIKPNGTISIVTKVTDHLVPLATKSLQNVSIQVHGQTMIDGRRTTARPITLNIDGEGPRIQYVEVSPWGGYVVTGTDLQLAIIATDSMSGIKSIEVGFDLERIGEFSAKAPPLAAVLDPQFTVSNPSSGTPLGLASIRDKSAGVAEQRWLAVLPTKDVQGVQTILFRAIDHLGNVSDYYSQRVQILTAEQAEQRIQQQTKTIEGMVAHRGRPLPAAEIALFAESEQERQADEQADEPSLSLPVEPIVVSRTGDDGSFSLGGVVPGKYRLSTQAIIRNKPHFAEREVLVDPEPGNVVRADLQVD